MRPKRPKRFARRAGYAVDGDISTSRKLGSHVSHWRGEIARERGAGTYGLEDDAGDVVLVGLEDRLHRLEVVVGGAEGAGGGALGHAWGVGQAEGDHAGARL
eukprot:1181614-Prorocentrum_minimum.AAC.2